MTNDKTDKSEELLKRLDTIVFLLLELKDRDGKMFLKDKIRLLNDAGLDYVQIAKALNKSPGSIAVQLTNLKKAERQLIQEDSEESIKTGVENGAS